MHARIRHWPRLVVALVSLVAVLASVRDTRAQEQNIIKRPGDHPTYSVELEPHVVFAPFGFHSSGWGLGARASIPIVKNGFVPTINNNVAIGFGLDWIHDSNYCYYNYYYDPRLYPYAYACPSVNSFHVPIVLQWNFFLSTHFSVFGEAGLQPWWASYGPCYAPAPGAPGGVVQVDCPNTSGLDVALFAGGRYHFSDGAALTVRVGYPYISAGVSFMP